MNYKGEQLKVERKVVNNDSVYIYKKRNKQQIEGTFEEPSSLKN